MVCKNCGQELEDNALVCSKCNTAVEEAKIHITYENEDTDYIEPPVITEAHTFIDEESFAQKVNDISDEEEDVSSKNPMIWVFIFLLVAIIGGALYFMFFSNMNGKGNSSNSNNTFTTENWTSGEVIIDGDFYHLPQSFESFYKKNWDLSSIESITNIEGGTTSDLVLLTSSLDNKHSLLVHLTNAEERALKYSDCSITGLMVNNNEDNNSTEFTLPGQITKGSKELEIQSIYGKLEDTNITYDDVLQATTYHYVDGNKNLELIVFDNGGLKSFHYYIDKSV